MANNYWRVTIGRVLVVFGVIVLIVGLVGAFMLSGQGCNDAGLKTLSWCWIRPFLVLGVPVVLVSLVLILAGILLKKVKSE